MDALKALIEKVDDDYLTGLCNKGIVKRSYKDLEQENPVLTWQGEEAQVVLKEAVCRIRIPLGESSCSCPSRSICRHIVTAVLWMKRELEGKAENTDSSVTDAAGAAAQEEPPPLLQELLEIPAERLKRACGAGHYRQFIAHINSGELPPIEESSIVTVTLPWENAEVRLLEPFAYSTCTCHSRELCVHKAQAVLAYQIEKGKISLQKLESLQETESTWDILQVRQACAGVCEAVSHQLCTGLSRQSPEVSESLERLSVITHRAGLPELESRLREAAAYYRQYFERSAAFRGEELLHKLLRLYGRSKKIETAESQEEIRPLAGTFRDKYEPAGRLRLTGMGGRTFSSRTGYEGEIYYFLEPQKKKWYTWTDARPVFYEEVKRRPSDGLENAPAPWGLNCSREQMQTLEFDLLNAKAASGGRLSVSQESKAEIIGARSLEQEEIRQMVVWDYERLLAEHFAGRMFSGAEKLALAGAVRWDEASFDTVQQRFSWSVYDLAGRTLYISLKYGREERLTINLLERLERKLREGKQDAIVFFGSLYMDEGGRMCMFPIEFFLKEAEALLPEDAVQEDMKSIDAQGDAEGRKNLSQAGLDAISQYCREAVHQLSDLFASGLYSVQEETIEQLSHFAEDGERLGLHLAGTDFNLVAELLRGKRHQMEFTPKPVLEAMGRLDAYLRACRDKLSYDKALLSMDIKYYNKGENHEFK